MIKKLVFFSLLLSSIKTIAMSPSIDQNNQLSNSKIDSLAISIMNARNVPGCVISVVSDTSVLFQKAFGFSDLGKKELVSLNTRFFVGSVSKLITATGVVKAIEQGYLKENVDIAEYAPDLHFSRNFSDPITIKNLLSHTSGIDLTSIGRKTKVPEELPDLKDFLREFLPSQVLPPNKEMLYCNQAVALSAYLVENVTGSSFHEYLKNNIFSPLQMGNSTFEYRDDTPGVSKGYDKEGNQQSIIVNKDWPAQMLLTTAPDMTNFMIMHLNGGMFSGRKVLSNSSIELMQRQYFSYDSILPGVCLGFFEDDYEGNRSLWHDGSFTGFRTLCYLVPGEKIGIFIFNNGENSSFNWTVLNILLSSLISVNETEPIMTATEIYDGIVGEYQSNRYSRSSFIKLAALFERNVVRMKKDGFIEYNDQLYYRISPLRYRSTEGNKFLVFDRAENGKISAMYTAYPMMRKFEKIYGWQKSWLQFAIFSLSLIFSVSSLVVLSRVHVTQNKLKDKFFQWITYFQQSSQFLTIIFLLIGFLTSNEQDFTLDQPPFTILLSMSAGVLLLLSTLPQLILFIITFKNYSSKLKLFLIFSMTISWSFLLFMQNWNLLGFKY